MLKQHEEICPPATDACISLASSPDTATRPVCPVCNAMVATQHDLRLHIAAHAESALPLVGIVKGYSCRLCNKVLSSPSSLDRHLQSHSGTRPFQCSVCNVGFTTIPNMQRHMRKLHTDTSAGCSSGCSNADSHDSDDSSAGSTHKRPRIDDDDEAPLAFASGEPAAASANGSPHTPPPTPTPTAGRVFNCPVCHVNMFNLVDLENHLHSVHTDYMEYCDECGESFKNVRELNLHRYAAHRAKSRGDRDIFGFKDLTFIDFSSSKFPQIARAECEKSLHRAPNGPHQFPCECGRAFPCDEALVIHRKECPLSVYSPEGPADLRQRQTNIDDGDSRQDFFRKLDLSPQYKTPAERESIIAANAIPRPASPEEEQDPFLSDFRRMKKRGEFPCRLCSKVYPNLRALKGHCRYHAPVGGRYRCNMCRFEVPDKATLQRHIRTHNGARPFECRECNFGFTTKANCERHLRNRHQKSDRKDLEESTLYHKHEDPNNDPDDMEVRSPPASTKALEVKRTLFPEPTTPAQLTAPPSPDRRRSLDVATMTSDDEEVYIEDNDNQPLDLSTRRPTSDEEIDDSEPQDLSMGCCRSPAPGDTAGSAPLLAPPPPPPPIGAISQVYAAAAAAAAAGGGFPGYRIPLPQHPFGLQPYYNNLFGAPLPFGLLHGPALLAASTAGSTAAIPAPLTPQRSASPTPSLETTNPRMTPPLDDISERSATLTALPQPSPAQSTASTSTSSDSKMVLKNGVFVPKQKQVRYRTERPFGCNFCASRFTLSSNRERHIKHQHPDLWSHRHKRALTGRRRSTEPSDLPRRGNSPGSPASPRSSPASPRPAETAPSPASSSVEVVQPMSPTAAQSDDAKLAQIKTNLAQEDQEAEADELVIDETEITQDVKPEVAGKGAPTHRDEGVDLASVSRLLDNAQTQTFRQFFRDGEENHAPPATEGPSEDDEGHVSASHSEGNNSASDGNKSEGEAPQRPPKKKSAYSLAPNRVKCTYCGRMFPWSSSLRRHILTHTGQKPFSCRFCPLLFTTKSNCDRHLARKHRDRVGELRTPNSARKERTPRSSGSSASPASSTSSDVSPQRAVTRPHRCMQCNGSSFASLSKLKRHMASKHGETLDLQVHRSGYDSANSEGGDETPRAAPATSTPVTASSVESTPIDSSLTAKTPATPCDATPVKAEPMSSPIAADSAEESINAVQAGRDVTTTIPLSPPLRSASPPPINSTTTAKIANPGELPFKCHLCQGSFAKPHECVDHLRVHHEDEYEVLKSKGLLKGFDENAEDDGMDYTQDRDPQLGSGENLEQLRGKFPDYANRKVRCACCMRRFWSAEDLRRHMRTHTGAKPYACSVCQRCFTLKHSMVRHQRKHKENNNDSDTSNNNIPVCLQSTGSSGELSPRPESVDNADVPMDLAASRMLHKNGLNMAVGQVVVAFKDGALQRNYMQDEGDSGLIGNLLGIRDPSLIDRMLLSKSANDAEELLGVKTAARS